MNKDSKKEKIFISIALILVTILTFIYTYFDAKSYYDYLGHYDMGMIYLHIGIGVVFFIGSIIYITYNRNILFHKIDSDSEKIIPKFDELDKMLINQIKKVPCNADIDYAIQYQKAIKPAIKSRLFLMILFVVILVTNISQILFEYVLVGNKLNIESIIKSFVVIAFFELLLFYFIYKKRNLSRFNNNLVNDIKNNDITTMLITINKCYNDKDIKNNNKNISRKNDPLSGYIKDAYKFYMVEDTDGNIYRIIEPSLYILAADNYQQEVEINVTFMTQSKVIIGYC